MAYAVPPGEDDDLLNVLDLAHRRLPLPAWVSKDDLYRDLPQAIAADCFQATDGAGRPACYVLTPLRAMGGRTRRTVSGAGYWKVEKTTTLFPTAGDPTSPKPAPDGTCVKLSFILRPHNGPEGRNGWLMKQYLLPHAPGTPAGPALCKLYFKKSAAGASTAAAAPSARPLRVPASTSCASPPPCKISLKNPAAEVPSTAAAAAAKAAAAPSARPLGLPASTPCASPPPCKVYLKKPPAEAPSTAAVTAAKAAAAPSARPLGLPASTPCASPSPCKVYLKKPSAEEPSTAAAAAKAAASPSLPATSRAARALRVPASTPCAGRAQLLSTFAQDAGHPPRRQLFSGRAPLLSTSAQDAGPPPRRQLFSGRAPLLSTSAQDDGPPPRRQLNSARSPPPHLCTTPEREPSGPSSTPGRRWVLVQTEGTTPLPQPHHDRGLKRIYQILQLDEVQIEEGEVIEQGHYLKKKTKFCCDKSSYMMLKNVDFERLNARDVAH